MRRSMVMLLGTVCVASLLPAFLSLTMSADKPAKKAEAAKPPWQRLLQGDTAKKAALQEKKLAQLQEAEQFVEALKVAEALAELRAGVQGADHWQTIDARFQIEAIRRVLKAKKEEQKSYSLLIAMQRDADGLAAKGRYREEQPLLEQILAVHRKVLGEEHPDTARSYNNVAVSLHFQGKYREAEEVYRKALAIERKMLGEEHPNTARSYNNLARSHYSQGKYREAEEDYGKALAIYRKMLGKEHPSTATIYDNAAYNLIAQGKHREAEESCRKALAIQRKVLGEEHYRTAYSYGNLAGNLSVQGKHREAEEIYRKALTIIRKARGEEHPETAINYNNLAKNLHDQGKYQEAADGYRKALAIYRKVLGEEHPYTATSYHNLAANLNAQGHYGEAEEGLRKVLAIQSKVLGGKHPSTATSYHNLAVSLGAQGRYREAVESGREALAIFRKAMGEEHPNPAYSYINLAMHLEHQGNYPEAEEDYRKALAIQRKVLGEEHPSTAQGYHHLAMILDDQGKHKEAEEGLRKALAIQRKVLGEEHPDTAQSYGNLAYNLNVQGKHKEAEEDLRKALAIERKVLGEEHPSTVSSYRGLAYNLNDQGNYREAESYYLRAAESFAKARLHAAATGLERAAFTSKKSPLPRLAAVLARNGKADEAWQRFEESLARGTWDDLSARLRRPQAEREKQTQITARIDRLQKLIERVSVAKPTSEQSKQRDELLSQLRQAYDDLAAFTQQLEKKYGPVAGQVLASHQIQASLPANAALIAWLDIPGQPKAADPNGEHWAILLRSSGDPMWVRLSGSGDKGAWTDADTQLPARLREALQSPRGVWQPLAERLRKQRLDPLARHLKGVHRLIVLPSTALAGLPVEVIADEYIVSYAHSGTMYAHLRQQPSPTGEGLFALADPVFRTTSVVEKQEPLPPRGVLLTMVLPGSNAFRAGLRANDVLLRYGDTELNAPADFKPQPESSDPEKRVPVIVWRDGAERRLPIFVRPGKLGVAIAKEPAPQALAEQRRLDRLLASRGDGDWQELPGTRIEASALQRLFGASARLLQKSEASEQRLNELAASGELGKYRYLHLATHGEVNDDMPLRSAVILARDRLPDDQQRTQLLLSGQPIPDGRLEADEALRRWRLNADLVTLSACQTALGKYERGEGYVGFAQSLILCGTRSVCLSLWKVDDTATALLMERLYQSLLGKRDGLKKSLSKSAALAEAKSWLRTLPREEAIKHTVRLTEGVSRGKGAAKLPPLQMPQPAVRAREGDRPFAHPYYWAAFVLVGHAE